jgi:hypothetical protein
MPDHQKIVRFHARCNGSRCDELGPLLRETKVTYVYRRPGGGEAAISKRLAHYEPCPHCRKPEPQR